MNAQKNYSGRKPLRQRVADRKAGRVEETPEDKKRARLLKRVALAANILQGVGLVMLLFAVGGFVSSDFQFVNWDHIILYSAIFLLGRGARMVVSIYRSTHK